MSITEDYCELPLSIMKQVDSRTLQLSDAKKLNLGQVAHLATINSYTKKFVYEHFAIEWIPMKNGHTFFPHQIEIIQWMRKTAYRETKHSLCGGIVCLEMGLGKTLISLSWALMRPQKTNPVLIVCDKSAITVWKSEIEKFFGLHRVSVLFYHTDLMTSSEFKKISYSLVKDYDFVITTYEVLIRAVSKEATDRVIVKNGRGRILRMEQPSEEDLHPHATKGAGLLYEIKWDAIIADEAQNFTNPKTKKIYKYDLACE